jgi:CRISPR-associated protein Cmr5
MQTRSQKNASTAYKQVGEVLGRGDAAKTKYGSIAHKLPVLIRTAGLAQALEFVESRRDESQKLLLDHLAVAVGAGSRAEYLRRSREYELGQYVRLTQESLAALLWYKRFVQSVLKVEADEEEDA